MDSAVETTIGGSRVDFGDVAPTLDEVLEVTAASLAVIDRWADQLPNRRALLTARQ